jgi:SPP1 family phage portal protein
MNDLTPKQYEAIWDSGAEERKLMLRQQRYYDGYHDILARDDNTAIDGSQKSARVANFIKFGVDLYTGSIAGDAYNVSAIETRDSDTVNESPAEYRRVGTANNFDTADIQHLRTALIKGSSLELHEFVDGQELITPRDPALWKVVYNSDGAVLGAIHRSDIDKGLFFGDAMLENKLNIMVVYTDKYIVTYHRDEKKGGAGDWAEVDSITHGYRQVPLVVFSLNESMESIITEDLIGQQDEYNETDSTSGDDIRGDVDSILWIKGYSKDNIAENAEVIRQSKILPLPGEGAAGYLQRNTDFQRIESRIQRTRQHIFMMMSVPDIEEIAGATGTTSGIALRLKFKPMSDNAKYMIGNIRAGIRDRIELINAMHGATTGNMVIENVQVNIDFSLPSNRAEEWQNIGAVSGIVSHTKQLEMLSDVEDPDQERQRLAVDAEGERFTALAEGDSDAIQARNDATINELSVGLQPQIATAIDAISDAALAETLRRSSDVS